MSTVNVTNQTQPQTSVRSILTPLALDAMLRQHRGATFVTIVAKTVPSLTGGKSNPFGGGRVFKVSRVNGVAWHIYANSVQNQRDREGVAEDFKAQPRKWGERIAKTSVVEHIKKGETQLRTYLELKVERSLGHRYVWRNGEDLTTAEVTELEKTLPPLRQPSTQGTEKHIILRDYELSNILTIAIDGGDFIVVPM